MKSRTFISSLIFGLILAILLIGIKSLEYTYFSYKIGLDVYIGIIALAFLIIGVYFGATYSRRKEAKFLIKLREESKRAGFTEPTINFDAVNGSDLSKRELEVLREIAMGYTNKEIGEKLFVSENTIKTHLNNIYMKLEVNRRTQAISRARELNIIT
ncbi:MAG: response regulator transcription factor [Ignavibacteriae bacterium]|nr:response regulator transcription factor [Ignavibacteriota bacterium]MCB9242075.1 response regulator transcription factor [Ignavibacteriales bacterium]